MVDIALLKKLAELKEHEVDEYKRDLDTLSKIVSDFEHKLEKHRDEVDEFVNQVVANQSFNDNSAWMINGRTYFKSLSLKNKEIEQLKLDAIAQKDSAFEIFKASVMELKKLTKLIEKMQFQTTQERHKKSLIIDDELEMYRFNKVS